MERYHSPRIAEADELDGLSLPGEVQLALDDLAGSVREGLLALSVGVGLDLGVRSCIPTGQRERWVGAGCVKAEARTRAAMRVVPVARVGGVCG